MSNLLFDLPEGVQWNVMKFMRHPVAEIFMKEIFRSVVPRDMKSKGLKREPYKIVWKKRGYSHLFNMTYCDTPKHKHSKGTCMWTDSEAESDEEEEPAYSAWLGRSRPR